MTGVTLATAIILAILVVILRPYYALAVYIAALLWYPNYLTVSVGTIDLTMGRIVVLVLLLRCLAQHQIRSRFIWSRLDSWIALSMVVYVGMYYATRSLYSSIENRGGFVIDTWFAYLAVRFLLTDRVGFVAVVKSIAVSLIIMAVLGVAESVTGWRPFVMLCGDSPAFMHLMTYTLRWGLNRAVGPFGHSILFGCCFAMFLPLIYYLHHQNNHWRTWSYVFSAIVLIGALSSMSSGPWVMVILVIFCLAMEKYASWIKPMLIGFGLLCILITATSNRPFYHVIFDYMDPISGGGWHRAKMIDMAIEHFDEWWLIGYGGRDPGWGENLGMAATDITNEFVLAGVEYGVLGMIVLCGTLAAAFHSISSIYKKATDKELRSLCWSLGSVLFSVVAAWMSVSFFGKMRPLFYIILGMIGSLPGLKKQFMSFDAITESRPCEYVTAIRNGEITRTAAHLKKGRLVAAGYIKRNWRRAPQTTASKST